MWYYKNKLISSIGELPQAELLVGFVYSIECRQRGACFGKTYWGKKNFYSRTKKALTKKEISPDKRLKAYKMVVKESNWKTYYGSNAQLKEDVLALGAKSFHREILQLAHSSKELTYLEMETQIINNVLRKENCYNENVAGIYFPRDLIRNNG